LLLIHITTVTKLLLNFEKQGGLPTGRVEKQGLPTGRDHCDIIQTLGVGNCCPVSNLELGWDSTLTDCWGCWANSLAVHFGVVGNWDILLIHLGVGNLDTLVVHPGNWDTLVIHLGDILLIHLGVGNLDTLVVHPGDSLVVHLGDPKWW
jgi:hypothetical protein